SVIYESPKLRKEVLRLEKEIDLLSTKLEIQTMLATRDYLDAVSNTLFLKIGQAMRQISNAAGDIANLHISIEGQPIPQIFQLIISLSDESINRIKVDSQSWDGLTKNNIQEIEELFGIDLMAINRKNKWIVEISPYKDRLKIDDRVICRGSISALNVLRKAAKGKLSKKEEMINELETLSTPNTKIGLDIDASEQHLVRTISYLKKKSELALDLAFSALLLNDSRLADEVIRLETELDNLDRTLGNIALNIHSRSLEQQDTILNLIKLSKALEEISDAAALIISPLRTNEDTGIPPILKEIVQSTEEKISIYEVDEDSEAKGSSVGEFENQVHGMWIVAIFRPDRGYIIDPPESFVIDMNDTLIFKAYGKTKKRLKLYEEKDTEINDFGLNV
ncbi:MAG: potassium channel family protein, partial [Candidatus Thorarchaeota archaeon]